MFRDNPEGKNVKLAIRLQCFQSANGLNVLRVLITDMGREDER
jgi:hypothetical protein